MAICLALSLVVTAFAAEPTMNVSVNKSTVGADGEVKVTLTLNGEIKDLWTIGFNLYFNSDLFTLKSNTPAANVTVSAVKTNAKGSYYGITLMDTTSNGLTIKGKYCELVFTAKSVTEDTQANFTVEFDRGVNTAQGSVTCAVGPAATLTVTKPAVPATKVALSGVPSGSIEVGTKVKLTATVTPANSTDTVVWSSSDPTVVSVDQNGNIEALKVGKNVTITAQAGKAKATCKITVVEKTCDHTNKTHHVAVPATCTVAGTIEYWSCNDCDALFVKDGETFVKVTNVVDPAKGHHGGTATCVDLAVCDVCGESYGSLKKHTVVKVDKVDPTCSTTGTKAHYECSVCNKWFSDKNGTKEISEADKASYVIAADPELHVYDIVRDSYKEYDEGYYVEQFQCKCGDSYWLASVDFSDVDVKLVQKGKGDLKNAKVEVASTSVETKEVMSLYYNDTANAGDTLSLPVFFNYSMSATEAEAIAALKKDIAENYTFTVKAAATKSGWGFKVDKTYTVTVELDDAGKVVTKWVGSDNTEVGAEETPTITITGEKRTTGGTTGGSGSTTTDTTKNDGKKVESGKTFDAGIAMYVGLSVLSVTGGALVIGKKKERF